MAWTAWLSTLTIVHTRPKMKSISVTNTAAYSMLNPEEILEMMGWADERVKNVLQLHCAGETDAAYLLC